jgi:hypothetical protein
MTPFQITHRHAPIEPAAADIDHTVDRAAGDLIWTDSTVNYHDIWRTDRRRYRPEIEPIMPIKP